MEKEDFYNKIKDGEQQSDAISKKEESEALIEPRPYGSISQTSEGKFVAYDPVNKENLYVIGSGFTIKYFDTEAEAQTALDKLRISRHAEAIREKEGLETLIKDIKREYEEAQTAMEKARVDSEKACEISHKSYTSFAEYDDQLFSVKIGEKIPEMTAEGYKLQEAFERDKKIKDMAEEAYNDATYKRNEIASRLDRVEEKLDKLMQAKEIL